MHTVWIIAVPFYVLCMPPSSTSFKDSGKEIAIERKQVAANPLVDIDLEAGERPDSRFSNDELIQDQKQDVGDGLCLSYFVYC